MGGYWISGIMSRCEYSTGDALPVQRQSGKMASEMQKLQEEEIHGCRAGRDQRIRKEGEFKNEE